MEIINFFTNLFTNNNKDNTTTITALPFDILNIIIKYSKSYNLIFVCKTLKNTMYNDFTKCKNCDKIVKINNEVLWSTDKYNNCHTVKNFIMEENIILFEHNNIFNRNNETMFNALCILDILTRVNKNGMVVISQVIKIDLPYCIDIKIVSHAPNNINLLKYYGSYEFNIYGKPNICSNNMENPQIFLCNQHNKYTHHNTFTINIHVGGNILIADLIEIKKLK